MHIVQLGKYRFDAGNVGTDWQPIMTKAFDDPRDAMLELHRLIVTDGDGLRPTTCEIVADGAKRMSLNEFYAHIYGIDPVRRRDGSYGYPRLKVMDPAGGQAPAYRGHAPMARLHLADRCD